MKRIVQNAHGYGPAEEIATQILITNKDGSIDVDCLTIILLELRERIKDLEERIEKP